MILGPATTPLHNLSRIRWTPNIARAPHFRTFPRATFSPLSRSASVLRNWISRSRSCVLGVSTRIASQWLTQRVLLFVQTAQGKNEGGPSFAAKKGARSGWNERRNYVVNASNTSSVEITIAGINVR